MNIPPITSAQLRGARAGLKLTQDELAAALGVSPSSIRNWERPHDEPLRCSAEHAKLIEDYLKVRGVGFTSTIERTHEGEAVHMGVSFPVKGAR